MKSWEDRELEELKRHEGCKLKPYQDSLGVWTIGYGHTAHVSRDTHPITQEEAEELLLEDMRDAENDARKLFATFDTLDGCRKGVLVNMTFQLGEEKLSAFHGTIQAIEDENWPEVGRHMRSTLWAKQTPKRAKELAARMETGKYPND